MPEVDSNVWTDYLVAYGLLIRDGQALIVGNRWRWSEQPELVWTLPGGRAEPGEAIEAALVREFHEETGLRISPGPLLFIVEVLMPAHQQRFLSFTFAVEDTSTASPQPKADDDAVVEARFVPVSALPEQVSLETLRVPIRDWHAGNGNRYYTFTI